MIETIDYALQFAVLLLLCIYGARRAVRAGDRGWLLLAFFYACYALGDLYWLLCLLLEGATPRVFYVSELSWYAGYIFLCLLLRDVQERSAPQKTRLAVLAPLFAAAACVFFLHWGELVSNVISAVLMGRLGYLTIRGLAGARERGACRRFYLVMGAFFLNEYALWFASCFWQGDTLLNPYFWFDGLLTVLALLMARTYAKVAKA